MIQFDEYIRNARIYFESPAYANAYPTEKSAVESKSLQERILSEFAFEILNELKFRLRPIFGFDDFLSSITSRGSIDRSLRARQSEIEAIRDYLIKLTIHKLLQYPIVVESLKNSIARVWKEDSALSKEPEEQETRPQWTADYLNQVLDNGGAVYYGTAYTKTWVRKDSKAPQDLVHFKTDKRGNLLVFERYDKDASPRYATITGSGGKVFLVDFGVYPTPEEADDVEIQLFGKIKTKRPSRQLESKKESKKKSATEKEIDVFLANLDFQVKQLDVKEQYPYYYYYNNIVTTFNEQAKQYGYVTAINWRDNSTSSDYIPKIEKKYSEKSQRFEYFLHLEPPGKREIGDRVLSFLWSNARKEILQRRPELLADRETLEKIRQGSLSIGQITPSHLSYMTKSDYDENKKLAFSFIQKRIEEDGFFASKTWRYVESIFYAFDKAFTEFYKKDESKRRGETAFRVGCRDSSTGIIELLTTSEAKSIDSLGISLSPTMTLESITERFIEKSKELELLRMQKEAQLREQLKKADDLALRSRRRFTSPFEK